MGEKLQEYLHYFAYIKFYNYGLLSGMEENTCFFFFLVD